MKNEQQPQVSTKPVFSDVSRDLGKFHEVSGDVWKIFKKYFAEDADLNEFAPDVSALDEKYRDDALYGFMQDLLKVYFRQLNVIRGLRNGDSVEGRT